MRTLNLIEAAALLNMHPDTVQRRARSGDIPAAKPGKCWVFIEVDLLDWIRAQYKTKIKLPVPTYHSGSRMPPRLGGLASGITDKELEELLTVAPKRRRKPQP